MPSLSIKFRGKDDSAPKKERGITITYKSKPQTEPNEEKGRQQAMNKKGLLVILSGPAGSGKGTVGGRLRELSPFEFSVSATTRAPRPGEVDGVHYQDRKSVV